MIQIMNLYLWHWKPNTYRIFSSLWQEAKLFFWLLLGSSVCAASYVIFQVPYNIAAGGISGIGIIVNHFTDISLGTIFLVLNIPLLILGFFHLGRWLFLWRTALSITLFSTISDFLTLYAPRYLEHYPVTDDVFLSAVYAGIVGGIGGGFVYRAGATMGGTGVLGRIMQIKTGIPLSQVYLYTDGLIVISAGIFFGWELALYAMLTLFISGFASDYVLEGASRARTATIITDKPQALKLAIMEQLNRTVSYWDGVGGYSGDSRTVMMCTIYRPQLGELCGIISVVDPDAFVSIGVTQQVMGAGFGKMIR